MHSPVIVGGVNSSNFFGGSSIFSFNPLNAFSGTGSQNQTPDTLANKYRPPQNNPIKLSTRGDFFNAQTSTLPSDFGKEESDNNEDEDNENDLNPDDGTFLTGVDGEQVAAKKKRKKPKQKN